MLLSVQNARHMYTPIRMSGNVREIIVVPRPYVGIRALKSLRVRAHVLYLLYTYCSAESGTGDGVSFYVELLLIFFHVKKKR